MGKKKVALEHIQSLASLSKNVTYTNPERANRYVYLLRRIAMKMRLQLPREVKKSFCKHCYSAFAPGKNCRVRTRQGKLIYYCLECKRYTKLILKDKK